MILNDCTKVQGAERGQQQQSQKTSRASSWWAVFTKLVDGSQADVHPGILSTHKIGTYDTAIAAINVVVLLAIS